jgi:deazaflavin-dependent oxidoreductase (nitroreductase family)
MRLRASAVDLGFKALNVVHRSVISLSRGRIGSSALGMAVVELRTTGRRSGLARSTMLTAPVVEGERVVLVASKGGDDRDPDWLKNLLANPEVVVTIAGERQKMTARLATAEEDLELWPRVVAAYKPYGSYRRRVNRAVPLVICEGEAASS